MVDRCNKGWLFFLTHAGTAEDLGVDIRLDANTENTDTRSVDINSSTKVGEAGADISRGIDGTDSNGLRGRARRGICSILL